MKNVDTVVRWLVGILFILSGLVKLNDPVGTAIKMEEYFDVFSNDISSVFHYLVPLALAVGLLVVILEIVLGVALIIQWRMKLSLWALLLLIVFFTFLTFYSAAFNKVTDCGCFGDAIAMKPWQSFWKDIVLLVLIGYLFIRRKKFKSSISPFAGNVIMVTTLMICTYIAYHAIVHQPFIDFRPYKVGVDIRKAMLPSEELRYEYIMEKDGKKHRFDTFPSDNSYKFVEMVPLNPEAEPKITDYNIWNDEGDFTEASLTGVKLLVVFSDVKKSNTNRLSDIMNLSKELEGVAETWVVMSNDEETYENFRHEYQVALPYYFGDGTVLKTIIRAIPGLVLLKDGVILGKWNANDTPTSEQIKALIR